MDIPLVSNLRVDGCYLSSDINGVMSEIFSVLTNA